VALVPGPQVGGVPDQAEETVFDAMWDEGGAFYGTRPLGNNRSRPALLGYWADIKFTQADNKKEKH
jgi:hypothetical protein